MANVAFVFPGQGSQCVGMCKGFYEASPTARALIDGADRALGQALSKIMFDGPAETLDLTANTQPALLAAGYAAYSVFKETFDVKPVVLAGHSLGEYTALVAAGALGFDDALRLVRARGVFMQGAVPEGVGSMCAILGLDVPAVERLCEEVSTNRSIVVPANINTLAQVVISGHADAVAAAAEKAVAKGAKKVVMLKVSVPSHSPLMAQAAYQLENEMEKIKFGRFSTPVITNVEATATDDSQRMTDLLKRQLTNPVRWVESVEAMRASGVYTVVEFGPGSVLASLVRRIDRNMRTFNVSEPADVDAVGRAL